MKYLSEIGVVSNSQLERAGAVFKPPAPPFLRKCGAVSSNAMPGQRIAC
jgi:hypothetical protein